MERCIRQDLTVAQISRSAEIELGGFVAHASRIDDLECLSGDLWADSVSTDDCDLVRHKQPNLRQGSSTTATDSSSVQGESPPGWIRWQAIDHIVLDTSDVERSLAWYVDLPGVAPMRVDE